MNKHKLVKSVNKAFDWIQTIQCKQREYGELKRTRRVPKNGDVILNLIEEDGDPVLEVILEEKEYAAIRRYLMRNRLRHLNDEGVL